MNGDELRAFVKATEVVLCETGDNVYDFGTGRKLGTEEISTLAEVEQWELSIALDEWYS
jgi:hypothetical protein